MSEIEEVQRQFKVYFNGTKREEIANSGAKFQNL